MARVETATNTLRDKLRAEGGNVIALDAGDQFQGPLCYSTYKSDLVAELMTDIGFDAMAVGNHAFDDGSEELARLLALPRFRWCRAIPISAAQSFWLKRSRIA